MPCFPVYPLSLGARDVSDEIVRPGILWEDDTAGCLALLQSL
jgi:hypothetical protein